MLLVKILACTNEVMITASEPLVSVAVPHSSQKSNNLICKNSSISEVMFVQSDFSLHLIHLDPLTLCLNASITDPERNK